MADPNITGKENKLKTILIMEDEMDMRFYLMTLVKSLGHIPLITRDGVQGLEKLFASKPDMIIIDIMMPKKGGALVYQQIKQDVNLKDIPLMVFSGVDKKAFFHYVKMLNLKLDCQIDYPEYYVEKSSDPDYVKKMIENCIDDK